VAPVAVLYGTTDGRTAIAAERIAGVLERFVVKPIAGTAGGTDSSRDYDYTDRDAVDGFAADFADSLG
jgi:menaquinone-dependent protoporphyrinogen IX oxidase